MVKLLCAIVGDTGSAFPIEIDEGDWVGDLKREAKIENPRAIQCDAKDLQVFLAKKNNAWLTEADVKKGVDTAGLKHLEWSGSTLRLVGLSDEDVGGVDEEEAERGRGPVNVLLVVPEEAKRRPRGPAHIAAILPHILDLAPATRTERKINFKDEVCKFYECYRRKKR